MEFLRELSIEWMDYYASLMKFQYGTSLKQGSGDSKAARPYRALMRPIFGQIDPTQDGRE